MDRPGMHPLTGILLKLRLPATGIFLLLLASYAYFFPRWADWNQDSRFALVQALVEEHQLAIDDYYQQTGDYAIYGGHYFTDKAPGLSVLGAPVYAVFHTLVAVLPSSLWTSGPASNSALTATLRTDGTGLMADKVLRAASLYAVTLFTVSLPSAALWVLVYLFVVDVGVSRRVGLTSSLLCGLGTLAFPYSTVFYSHQTAAFLLFTAFYLLFRIKQRQASSAWLWLCGALLGLAVFTDFPSLLPTVLLLAYAVICLPRRTMLLPVIAAALPFAVMLAVYNYACFGSPLASSYRYLALFPEQSNYGLLGFSLPSWTAFWGITFSPYRGLFFSSPFLLLAGPGIWLGLRGNRWRAEVIITASIIAVYLLLISCYYDWKGGFAVAGPRNLIPMLPFAALPVARALSAAWRSRVWRPIIGISVLWSCLAVFVQTAASQAFAPITISNPLFDFFLPALLVGDINRNLGMVLRLGGWSSLAPLVVFLVPMAFALWVRADGALTQRQLNSANATGTTSSIGWSA